MRKSPEDRRSFKRATFLSLILSVVLVGVAVLLVTLSSRRHNVPTDEASSVATSSNTAPIQSAEDLAEKKGPKASGEKPDEKDNEAQPIQVPPLLRGRVTGEGAPIAGASVLLFSVRSVEKAIDRIEEILPQGEMPDIPALVEELKGELEKFKRSAVFTVTATDGTYEFRGIDPTGYVVLTVAKGWLFHYGDVVSISEGRTEELNVDLPRGEAVAGRVVSTDGKGVPGAAVIAEFHPGGAPGLGMIARRLLRYVNGEFLKGPFETATAADGSFSIGGLPPGMYDLAASQVEGIEARLPGVETGTTDAVVYLGNGAFVTGYLADLDGFPVPGIVLTVERQEDLLQLPLLMAGFNKLANTLARFLDEPPKRVVSGEKGEFLVGPLAPGKHRLSVELPGFLPMERPFDVNWDERLDLGLIRLDRGEAIAGVVLSEAGSPVAGAKVLTIPAQVNLFNMGGTANDVFTGRAVAATDTSGAFRLSGLPKGQYMVIATARGFAPGRSEGVAAGGEPVTIHVRRGIIVSGRVVDGTTGRPVAEARVRAADARTRTDADGRFVLDGVAPRERNWGNMFGGFGGERGGPQTRRGGGQDPGADPGAETGSETTVSIQAAARDYLDGRASIDLAAPPAEGIEIALSPAPEIIGMVFDPDGKPLPGSLVRLVPWVPERLPAAFDFLEKGAIFLACSVSDLEGKFRLSQFRGGNARQQYRVMAEHVLYARGVSEPFVLEGRAGEDGRSLGVRITRPQESAGRGSGGSSGPELRIGAQPQIDSLPVGDPGAQIEVHLTRASAIRGIVTDGAAPVAGATVRLTKGEPAQGQDARTSIFLGMLGLPKGGDLAYTNREGKFAYEHMRPGDYTLEAEVTGFNNSAPQTVRLAGGEEREVTLIVDPGGEIRGVVVDDQGTAVPQARARLHRQPEGGDVEEAQLLVAQKLMGGAYKSTRSGADGAFSIRGLPRGTYALTVDKEGYSTREIAGLTPDGPEQRVVLLPGATVAGVVLDRASRQPIPRFRVKMRKAGEPDPSAAWFGGGREYSDGEGRFQSQDLEPGTYEVEVAATGFLPEKTEVILPAGTKQDVTFLLGQAGRIRGVVVGLATQRPIAGVRVGLGRARDQNASGDQKGSEGSRGASGAREASERRKERRELAREAREGRNEQDDASGGSRSPAASPEDDDQQALAGYLTEVYTAEATRTRDDGSYLLEGVPAGPQRLVFTHADHVSVVRTGLEVAPGEELEINAALPAGLEISGKVKEEDGTAGGGRWLFVRGIDEGTAHLEKSAITDLDGGFRIGGLAAGSYRILVAPRGGGGGAGAARRTTLNVDLRESRSDVDITVAE